MKGADIMDCLDVYCLSRKPYIKVKDDPRKNRHITVKQMNYITGLLPGSKYKLKDNVILENMTIHHASLVIKVLTGEKRLSSVTSQYLAKK